MRGAVAAVGGPEIAGHAVSIDAILADLDPAITEELGAHWTPHSTRTRVMPLPEGTVRRVGCPPRSANPSVSQTSDC